jgi:hypothetical protein
VFSAAVSKGARHLVMVPIPLSMLGISLPSGFLLLRQASITTSGKPLMPVATIAHAPVEVTAPESALPGNGVPKLSTSTHTSSP